MSDDRSTRARIRDAAIAVIARDGVGATTARSVAAEAGVSAGSVIHHFVSMDGLRQACDEHVVTTIRAMKQRSIAQGPSLDLVAAMRDEEAAAGPLLGYLAQVLTENSQIVATLVDDLVEDAVGYMKQGAETGMIRPVEDARGQAVVLMIWSLGALVLHRHLDRLLGVDLADPSASGTGSMTAYIEPAWSILGQGIFTDDFARTASEALASQKTQENRNA